MLEQSKLDLQDIQVKRVESLMFRSKAKWYTEGEMNTKYFLNLEKARYNAKACVAIYDETGVLRTDPERILNIQSQFYGELYTSDATAKFDLDINVDQEACEAGVDERQFTIGEMADAVKMLKNGSCPGPDGLPVEVYKMLWPEIKDVLHEMICETYEEMSFPETASSGVLNLIPKGTKDTRYLKNLRPITLLNCDYKIVEKMVANRMTPSLCEIIHTDQTGFLPGRRIAANIRKLLDLIVESEANNEENIIISCDYMKCFDRVEIESVIRAMDMFKFSNLLKVWVSIMYDRFSLKVQNCGYFSPKITPTRGLQ